MQDLEEAILAYVAETNADPKPFVWTKTADDILASVARFCLRTSNSNHYPCYVTFSVCVKAVFVGGGGSVAAHGGGR